MIPVIHNRISMELDKAIWEGQLGRLAVTNIKAYCEAMWMQAVY